MARNRAAQGGCPQYRDSDRMERVSARHINRPDRRRATSTGPRRSLEGRRDFVTLTDVSDARVVLSLTGPSSRELLQRCTGADVSNSAFPFGCSRQIDLGYVLVRANRVTHVRELGWELFTLAESGERQG